MKTINQYINEALVGKRDRKIDVDDTKIEASLEWFVTSCYVDNVIPSVISNSSRREVLNQETIKALRQCTSLQGQDTIIDLDSFPGVLAGDAEAYPRLMQALGRGVLNWNMDIRDLPPFPLKIRLTSASKIVQIISPTIMFSLNAGNCSALSHLLEDCQIQNFYIDGRANRAGVVDGLVLRGCSPTIQSFAGSFILKGKGLTIRLEEGSGGRIRQETNPKRLAIYALGGEDISNIRCPGMDPDYRLDMVVNDKNKFDEAWAALGLNGVPQEQKPELEGEAAFYADSLIPRDFMSHPVEISIYKTSGKVIAPRDYITLKKDAQGKWTVARHARKVR